MDGLGTIFEARGGLSVVATHTDGSLVTYDAPPAAAGEPTLDGGPLKTYVGGSSVRALAPGTNGEVFAFVSNGVNSLVVGLISRREGALLKYGVILDAATADTGQLEALAYDPSLSTNDIQLVTVDPVSLHVTQTIDTGVNPRVQDAHLQTHSLVITKAAVFVYIVTQSMPPAATQTSRLIKVPIGSPSGSLIPTGVTAGLEATAGADGRIYLYDGPARNQVFVVDSTTGSMAVDPDLTAPNGTFVRAVFV